MTKKSLKKMYANNPMGTLLIMIILVGFGAWALQATGLVTYSINPLDEDPVDDVVIPERYTISIKNITGSALDGKDGAHQAYLQLYRYAPTEDGNYDDISDFDQDDWDALTFSDFEQVETNAEHGDTFTIDYTPNVDAWYWYTVTCSEGNTYNEYSAQLFPISSYKDSKGVIDGKIEIELMQKPDATVIGAISDEGDQSYVDGTTTADVWVVTVYCYDEDDQLTDDYGYKPYLDFDAITTLEELDDAWVYPMIRLDFNATTGVNSTTVDLSGHSYYDTETSDGNYDVYFNEIITLSESIVFDIDSGIYGAGATSTEDLGITDFEFGLAAIGESVTSVDTVL